MISIKRACCVHALLIEIDILHLSVIMVMIFYGCSSDLLLFLDRCAKNLPQYNDHCR